MIKEMAVLGLMFSQCLVAASQRNDIASLTPSIDSRLEKEVNISGIENPPSNLEAPINLQDLPSEVLEDIFHFLSPLEVLNTSVVSKTFYSISRDEKFWRFYKTFTLDAEEFERSPKDFFAVVKVVNYFPELHFTNFANVKTPTLNSLLSTLFRIYTPSEEVPIKLFFNDCHLGTKRILALVQPLKLVPNIRQLNLSGNNILKKTAIQLLKALASSSVHIIDLSHNLIESFISDDFISVLNKQVGRTIYTHGQEKYKYSNSGKTRQRLYNPDCRYLSPATVQEFKTKNINIIQE